MTRRRTIPSGTAPDMLTIEEAARILRIGRSAAYQLAREYLAAEGASGMPTVRIGGQFRVPRHLLEEYLGGPVTWPIPDAPAPGCIRHRHGQRTDRGLRSAPVHPPPSFPP